MNVCPERDLLRTMLVDEACQEELERHLAACTRCAREAEAIMDEEISCLRREYQPEEDPSRTEALSDLKRKIRERGVRDDGAAEEATAPPDRIGPYEILEPLGKGGMGTVYKARQPNTGRIVALKVIHKDLMSARLVRRFRHEAEILAELEHAGIATVYDAGSWHRDDGDVPYLVMELVDGSRITQHVASRELTLHQRLALIAAVCDAVGYAHQHGFIHRDLKPSNILVNQDGQPKVVDFGVAHDTRRAPAAAETDMEPYTRTGEIVGSSFYISPEQLRSDSRVADMRSDVYSLGMVSFELLSGKLPYDFPSHALIDVSRAISDKEPYRLAKFRTDCRGDVTTIIAKALEQDPEKRYQTADEFAADLRRLLAREPIHARPVSLRERAWLFCRRKPLLCALVAVMLLVVLALAVGGPLLAASFRAARLRAETSQQRAERREGESRELLEYLGRVSADELQGKEGVGELRTKMLKKVLSYHQKFVKEQQSSSNMLQLADAHFEIGYLSNSLGDVQEAKRAYEQALSILDRLAVERANVQARKKRAETFHNLANVQMSLRDYDDALRCLSHAVSQWEELSHDEPGNLEYVQGVVMALNVRAMVFRAQGDYDSALRIYEASVSRHEAWLSEDPDNGAHRHNLWMLLGNLGNLYDDLDRFADARRAFERALEESRRLYEAGPSCASRIRLAESHASLALVLGHLGIVDECLANFGKAVEIHREVVRDFPGDPGNRVNLSRALHNMSCRLLRHDRLQEAMGPLEEAIRERRQLVLVQPDNLGWRLNLANSLGELGTAHHLMGDHDRAREEYEETLAILTELVDAAPNDLESRRRRSATHLFMAKLLLEMNDAVAALQQLEDGLHQQEHVADAAFLADDHDRVAELHRWKGMALAALGRKEEALAAYQTAAELWQRIGGHGHVVTARALAACISLAPDETAVEQFAQRALDALRRAVAQNAVDLETLDTDPDLAPLRKRAEYEAIRGAVTAKQ